MKLSTCDFTFPKLRWEQTLKLARELGVESMDLALFMDRSHLDPRKVFADPAKWALYVTKAYQAEGLEIADVYGQVSLEPADGAMNHPDAGVRKKAADFFHRILEFTLRCNAHHLSLLPGVHFPQEDYEDALKRSAEELAWRVEAARALGVVISVEPHIGSVVPTPPAVERLMALTPGLTLALDYTHFACQGIPDREVEPLLKYASHFHARGGCKGKLQSSVQENTIDYARIVTAMKEMGYSGYIALEYVWTEWMGCNQVDNLSETILLRDLLLAADQATRA